ncbi:hypothetical protein TH66_06485 [Carbonactinospora thermoautotrophica]|uniref:HTH cro/C1-type domain-containing protein n=3 Tax=Carbonactinospora thermoautotrophica TaxID=1469144 RepID=A0A132N3Z2_9ACTN|nr:DUF2690 domain-containing protein [Carbonactinospora thermoautotrophica]KWX04804.1 hypothetical protein TH66_06485 [Carbonactinospora thermoautotrophica]
MSTTGQRGPDPESHIGRFAAYLRERFQRSGMTLAQLEKLTGISDSSLSRYFTGQALPQDEKTASRLGRVLRADRFVVCDLYRAARAEDQARKRAARQQARGRPVQPAPTGPPPPAGSSPEPGPQGLPDDTPLPQPPPPTEPQPGALDQRDRRRWLTPVLVGSPAVIITGVVTLALANLPTEPAPAGPRTSGTPTAVEPLCRGRDCRGKDAEATRCAASAQTVQDTWLRGLHVELRYSRPCAAVWARITGALVGDIAEVVNRHGVSQRAPVRWGKDVYSPMVETDDPRTAWACGITPTEETCTPRPAAGQGGRGSGGGA